MKNWIKILAVACVILSVGCVAPPPMVVIKEGKLSPGESIMLGPVQLSSTTHTLDYKLQAPEGDNGETQRTSTE